jgi:hypothetical protein
MDSAEAQVEAGPQGGHHIWIAVRMKGLLQSGSITSVTGHFPELNQDIGPFQVIFTFDQDEGGYCKLYGLRFQVDQTLIVDQVLGKTLDVQVKVTDKEGAIGIGAPSSCRSSSFDAGSPGGEPATGRGSSSASVSRTERRGEVLLGRGVSIVLERQRARPREQQREHALDDLLALLGALSAGPLQGHLFVGEHQAIEPPRRARFEPQARAAGGRGPLRIVRRRRERLPLIGCA